MSKTYAEAYDDISHIFTFQDHKALEKEINYLKDGIDGCKKFQLHLFILVLISLLLGCVNMSYYRNVEKGLDDMISKMSLAIELMDNENYTKI